MLRKSLAVPSLSATMMWFVGVAAAPVVEELEEVEVDLGELFVTAAATVVAAGSFAWGAP